jgi:hypothetical protein
MSKRGHRMYMYEGAATVGAHALSRLAFLLGEVENPLVFLFILMLITPLVAAGCSLILVGLLILTPLGFVVFLPMRAAHAAWLLWRHVRRRCPYDDCGRAGLPIHVCSCGARYDDLMPNVHGIFFHTCVHGYTSEVRLPTMDFLGRSRLPRLCRHCERPLLLDSLGELAERPIAVAGAPGVGKTVFLRQAVRELARHLGDQPGNSARVDSPEQERGLRADLDLLDHGQVLAKTGGDVAHAFALALRLHAPRRLRALLYLFDAPGEDWLSVERFGRKQVHDLAGVVLLLDPFALPGLEAHARLLRRQASPSDVPVRDVVSVLVNGLSNSLGLRPSERCAVPVAVVLGKADALPAAEMPFLAGLCAGGGAAGADLSGRCREALVRLGGGAATRALEMKFLTVRYFACSPLGRAPDPKDARPFRPAGVAEPLLWLLGLT